MRNGKRDIRNILNKIYRHESLAGVDLRNLYLSCMDLSKLDLRGANFEGLQAEKFQHGLQRLDRRQFDQ